MVSLLLLGPSVPMLFQGQECATASPFTYFADHEGELAEAVRNGRLEFLSQFPTLPMPETREVLPDPGNEAAFRACRDQLVRSPGVRGGQAAAHGSADAAPIRRRLVDARYARDAGGDIRADAERSCCCAIRRTRRSG